VFVRAEHFISPGQLRHSRESDDAAAKGIKQRKSHAGMRGLFAVSGKLDLCRC